MHPWRFHTGITCKQRVKQGFKVTHILLLLMNVADLEPDVLLIERPRRIGNDILETLRIQGQ